MRKIWSTDDISAAMMGRRSFLTGSAALLGGAALAPMLASQARAEVGGSFQLMAWEGFELTDELADWYVAQNITPEFTAMGSQDDVTIRFNAPNPPPFDAAQYNQGYADLYLDTLKLCKPLDLSKLPNYSADNLFDMFFDKPTWFRDGTLYGVPYAWGLNAIVFNPAMIAKPTSYKDLLAPELTGKLAFVDDTLATWPLMAVVTGYGDKFPNLTKDELADMYAKLEPYRAQSRVVSPTYGDVVSLFNSGEVAALFCGWTGIPQETAKSGVTTEYTIPEEGAGTWCDAWFIPKSSDNDDTAYAYFDQAISPEIQAKVAARNSAGVVSKKAVELLPPEARALFDYDNADTIFEKAPLLGLPPMESTELATYADWVEAWNAFKAF